jgi:hypothetical protein
VAERNREFVLSLEVAKSIRVCVCRTACFGAKIICVDDSDFARHAVIPGICIVCTRSPTKYVSFDGCGISPLSSLDRLLRLERLYDEVFLNEIGALRGL